MITEQRAATGLIQKYLGTAYDNVQKVADSIEDVTALAEVISQNTNFNDLASVLDRLGDSIDSVAALAAADLSQIASDLEKGNYLGNRKIDIDLNLNNNSTTTEVAYRSLTLTLNDGTEVPITFAAELTSYSALYNELVDGIAAYNAGEANAQLHVKDFEIDILNSTLPDVPTLLNIRDADGKSCNIDRVVLQVQSGEAKEQTPAYYWSKTTSSLQTLSNRIGDVIALGNDIDAIIQLSYQTDEINYLYTNRDVLTGVSGSIYASLTSLMELHGQMATIQANADTASTKASEASASASSAATHAAEAAAKNAEIKRVAVGSTVTAAAGQMAEVTYNPATGLFTFVVPKGDKGDKGDAFQVNAVGPIANRNLYDAESEGFSFLAIDESLIYFRIGTTAGVWSTGAAFGKGDKGDKGDTGTTDYNGLINVPTEFPPSAHGHAISGVTGLQAALDAKAADNNVVKLSAPSVVAAHTTWNDGYHVRLGTGGDFRLHHDGTNNFMDLHLGDLFIRDGATTRFTFGRVSGDLTLTGNLSMSSDSRLKTDIKPIRNALAKVRALGGYTYERTDMDVPRQTGVIAQEVLDVLPEAVQLDSKDRYTVSYGNLVGLLIESIKELSEEVRELKHGN